MSLVMKVSVVLAFLCPLVSAADCASTGSCDGEHDETSLVQLKQAVKHRQEPYAEEEEAFEDNKNTVSEPIVRAGDEAISRYRTAADDRAAAAEDAEQAAAANRDAVIEGAEANAQTVVDAAEAHHSAKDLAFDRVANAKNDWAHAAYKKHRVDNAVVGGEIAGVHAGVERVHANKVAAEDAAAHQAGEDRRALQITASQERADANANAEAEAGRRHEDAEAAALRRGAENRNAAAENRAQRARNTADAITSVDPAIDEMATHRADEFRGQEGIDDDDIDDDVSQNEDDRV